MLIVSTIIGSSFACHLVSINPLYLSRSGVCSTAYIVVRLIEISRNLSSRVLSVRTLLIDFLLCSSFMQHFFFLSHVRVPFRDYNNLSKHGVRFRGRNFYLNADSAQDLPKLGVWHILPESLSERFQEQSPTDEDIETSLRESDNSIVVYLHGTAWDRAAKYRCKLYNVLSKMGYHVLALDYRGYGDSTGCPNENGLIQDAHAIYNYARQMAPSKDIFVWGHSMGSGVAARTVAELCDAGTSPTAIVLESPFNNIPDVVRGHTVGRAIGMLPFGKSIVDKWVIGSMTALGLELSSDLHVERVTCPILVLHAHDDHVVSVELARKLVEKTEAAQRRVTYIEFEAHHKFKHENIHRAENLPDILRDFFDASHNSTETTDQSSE